MAVPTSVSRKNYPDSVPPGYYEDYPCTCDPQCDDPCKGGCGCEACSASYEDYLSSPLAVEILKLRRMMEGKS